MGERAEGPVGYFLSYSRSDEAFALRLSTYVRAEGIRLWVDQLDIRPSERWDRAIERAVKECRGIVVIVSPRSIASDNVADEISYAIDAGKIVIPVMIERCNLPLRITRMQVIDATANHQNAFKQCVAELRRNQVLKPSSAPAPGHVPIDQNTLDLAKGRLAAILGPIAQVLTEKAAARAKSAPELYRLLSLHIEEQAEREYFLGMAQETTSTEACADRVTDTKENGVSAAEVQKAGRMLARYLGPIAPLLANREAKSCHTLEELGERLRGFIPAEGERDEFLVQLLAR